MKTPKNTVYQANGLKRCALIDPNTGSFHGEKTQREIADAISSFAYGMGADTHKMAAELDAAFETGDANKIAKIWWAAIAGIGINDYMATNE